MFDLNEHYILKYEQCVIQERNPYAISKQRGIRSICAPAQSNQDRFLVFTLSFDSVLWNAQGNLTFVAYVLHTDYFLR